MTRKQEGNDKRKQQEDSESNRVTVKATGLMYEQEATLPITVNDTSIFAATTIVTVEDGISLVP